MVNYSLEKNVVKTFKIEDGRHLDGALHVLNLTDIHYSHDRKNLPLLLKRIRKTIVATNPDLITLTGDQISFFVDLEDYLRPLCDFIDGFNIPWAPILGNHEGFDEEQRCKIGDFYSSGRYKNILFIKNESSLGVGNYLINLTYDDKIVHSVFMMDSHTDKIYPDGKKDYDYVWESQHIWYKELYDALKLQNEGVKTSCYLHIPLAEYEYAWRKYKKGLLKGKNANCEVVCCPKHNDKSGPYNNGFFDVIKSASCKLVLCGHDHTNTASIDYEGVTLAYSFCTRQHRICNGRYPLATIIKYDANGDFCLENYVWSLGNPKIIDNLGKKYSK